ncbi:MAG: BlaI/MecI/CopY family transcriptional regulator [Saprospiraceae bacterium]|nr:BlaI/MecI/CopY family transcriptional regulator [Bacteroidia bacterium]MBT8230439.1 BlaI/MecI/CopY family transcriptional regulator [Bacteroidia bacterium]NNF22444.1 BlaI/MecI/CopY family transcriptional regulator [Saprospiraceae bacterium]NNK90302.1 BlaI/MecI/CopY family transcriptional regulator [Saprospiraceae bacterium]
MKRLTRSEEELMQMIWQYGPCTVSQLISHMDNPKPPHSTISSIMRILEKKGFVNHKAYGRTYEYFAVVDKQSYSRFSLKNLAKNYFEGSMNDMVSFLVRENDLSLNDLGELLDQLDNDKRETK